MISVSTFDPMDLVHIKKTEAYADDKYADSNAIYAHHSDNSFVHTVSYGGVPIAILGITFLWPGVGYLWGILGEGIKKCPKSFVKVTRQLIEQYAKNLGLWRVHMDVIARYHPAIRFAESIGLTREGLMKKFGSDGHDYYRYARLF